MANEAAIQADVAEAEDNGLGTEKETTVTDIVPDAPLPAEAEVKTDRNTMVEMIAERRRKELADEMGEPISDDGEGADDAPAEGGEATAGEDEAPIEVKINGKTGTVTAKQIADYQKGVAADQRLEEAAKKQRELDQREADLAAREAALRAPKPEPVVDTVTDEEVEGLAAELIKSVFSEDQVAVASLIRKMRAAPGQTSTSITQEEIDARVNQALAMGETKKAVKRFSDEYPDLDKDQTLRDLVDKRTIIERANDPSAAPWDIIDRSAKYVNDTLRKKFGGETPATPDPVIDDLEERRRQKREAQGAVKSGAAKTAPVNPGPAKPALTPVQEIMKARGQL